MTETLVLMEGRIKISSKPAGAEVLIDGESKGKTPLDISLPMGSYQIEISKDDYVKVNADVVLSQSRPEMSLDQPLQLIRGSLTINSQPAGAKVLLSGDPKGETPLTLELPMGPYQVELSKKNYVTVDREIILTEANQDQSLKRDPWSFPMGSLVVTSPQSEVAVSVNGEAMGQTPLTLALPMGRYLVKFSKQDYVSVIREVELTEAKPDKKAE